jgi:hypothetical protein
MVVFPPEGAKFIASFGWTKSDVKHAMWLIGDPFEPTLSPLVGQTTWQLMLAS